MSILHFNNDQAEQPMQQPYTYVNCCIESGLYISNKTFYI